jgi:predicted MFS family arabinose efflux permease
MSLSPFSAGGAPPSERRILFVLAAIQFTAIVDFLIIMPLGPQYMRVLGIGPGQFGIIVSAYAVAAGIAGVAASLFLDHFNRKTALLWLYAGFAVSTLLCALAPTYHLLVAARVAAGAFGGVAGSLILAIIGDVVPAERRGAAMGLVMSSFSIASICGVPLGLVLASEISWHVPFFALAGISAAILLPASRLLPPLQGHKEHVGEASPMERFRAVLLERDHQKAFLFMAILTCAGFLIFPYISNYMVMNVGLTEKQLPLIYVSGGLCTLFSMNWIGRWADRAGKLPVFRIASVCAIGAILTLTNLPRVPVALAIASSTALMICMSGRMVPAMALMTGAVEPRFRGGFMSINSAVQQFSSGIAAVISGAMIGQGAHGELTRFRWVGVLSACAALSCIYLAKFLKAAPGGEKTVDPIPME